MMLSMRRMVQESVWKAIITLLAQARIEARDSTSAPPLLKVKREQVLDILGLLIPFEEAIQVNNMYQCCLYKTILGLYPF